MEGVARTGPDIVILKSNGQSVTPGMSMGLLGKDFGNKPGECGVVFITPVVAKTIIDAVKLILGGIPSLKNLKKMGAWEAAKAVKSALDQLKTVADFATDAVPTMTKTGVVVMWTQKGSGLGGNDLQDVNLGICPQKANCGWLPKPGILLPVCKTTGNGASMKILVIGKSC